jgi:alkylation response protein AidB-like acyl-CoA dehydrogenase
VAAAAVGVVADSLEAMSEITAKRIANDEAAVTLDQVESHIAQTAVELEAARALVYAAAELKAEYDPRPTRGHLRLETDTLVAEAKHFAVGVVNRMFSRAARIDVAGTPLNELLPERHRRVPRATVLFEETAELLEEKIAPYYLF